MMHVFSHQVCRNCGDDVDLRRWSIGFELCLPCGEERAQLVKHTIVPLHKSNYILVTDMELLKGINNKYQP